MKDPHDPQGKREMPETFNPAYIFRRFQNWFTLGLAYACFYMGRYNFNVVKVDIGREYGLDKAQMGTIATAAFWTYGLSVLLNGPLADRWGGKKAIIFGGIGSAVINLLVGLMFLNEATTRVLLCMSIMWSANMYFSSFGALSVVKVNAPWFHVSQRGRFGGIFGAMISSGYFLATSVGGWVAGTFGWRWVFIAPVVAMSVMAIINYFCVENQPSNAGFENFNTGDVTSNEKAETIKPWREVVFQKVILVLIAAEFCTGFVRQGVMLYFTEYLEEVYRLPKSEPLYWWTGVSFMFGGIFGGMLCGWLSDKVFGARRPPVAFFFYLTQIGLLILLGTALGQGTYGGQVWAVVLLGIVAMFIFGVHGMLSGTASMDFGGVKRASTVAGLLDGIQYIGSGLTGFGLGWILKNYGWDGTPVTEGYVPANAYVWILSIIPFCLMGALLMLPIWNARPRPKEVEVH